MLSLSLALFLTDSLHSLFIPCGRKRWQCVHAFVRLLGAPLPTPLTHPLLSLTLSLSLSLSLSHTHTLPLLLGGPASAGSAALHFPCPSGRCGVSHRSSQPVSQPAHSVLLSVTQARTHTHTHTHTHTRTRTRTRTHTQIHEMKIHPHSHMHNDCPETHRKTQCYRIEPLAPLPLITADWGDGNRTLHR